MFSAARKMLWIEESEMVVEAAATPSSSRRATKEGPVSSMAKKNDTPAKVGDTIASAENLVESLSQAVKRAEEMLRKAQKAKAETEKKAPQWETSRDR
jgi:hypothetical protein